MAATTSVAFPPAASFSIGNVQGDGSVNISISLLQLLQSLWAAVQGTGGLSDLSILFAPSAGATQASAISIAQEIGGQYVLMQAGSPAAEAHQVLADAVLLGTRPAITVPISDLLDMLTTARGSLLYRGASGWTALAPGTAGQFLQTEGAAADPQWANGTTAPSPFAGLPSFPADGARAFITDGAVVAAGNFGTAAAGGGANHVPVYYDGGATQWRIG